MRRTILGVLGGYAVMFAGVFALFTLAYVVLGTEGSFKPDSFQPSTTWLALSIVLGFVAAYLGGFVCVRIAQRPTAPKMLATLVLILGVLSAVPTFVADTDAELPVRTGELSNFEAMQGATQPKWIAAINPFLGALGIMLGARRRREPAAPMEG